MTNQPIPSTEAVEAAARRWCDESNPAWVESPRWDELGPNEKRSFRKGVLMILVAAYPQIVADVLNHYADVADARPTSVYAWERTTAPWLREQAKQVSSQ